MNFETFWLSFCGENVALVLLVTKAMEYLILEQWTGVKVVRLAHRPPRVAKIPPSIDINTGAVSYFRLAASCFGHQDSAVQELGRFVPMTLPALKQLLLERTAQMRTFPMQALGHQLATGGVDFRLGSIRQQTPLHKAWLDSTTSLDMSDENPEHHSGNLRSEILVHRHLEQHGTLMVIADPSLGRQLLHVFVASSDCREQHLQAADNAVEFGQVDTMEDYMPRKLCAIAWPALLLVRNV